WPRIPREQRGTDSITLTAFRVNGTDALAYWDERLQAHGVKTEGIEHFAERSVLRFEDAEGQRLMLVDDQGAAYHGEIWDKSDIPEEFALRGFYAAMISVPKLENVEPILTRILGFT